MSYVLYSITVTVISETVMRVTDNLATSLQASKLSASEGRTMAERTVDCLTQMRNENKFEEIYVDAVKLQKDLGKWFFVPFVQE